MRRSTLAKVLLMFGLLVTSVTVTWIVVPTKSKSSTVVLQQEADLAPDVGVSEQDLKDRLAQIKGVQPRYVANTKISLVFAQGGLGSVLVKAEAEIRDTRPGMAFMWGVRLVDPEDRKTVLYENKYTDQVTPLEPGQVHRPTFEDLVEVPLEPGDYVFEVFLYRVPGGDPEVLERSGLSARWRSSIARNLVTIN